MIVSINGLKLPPSTTSTSELFEAVTSRQRSAGGTLITKPPVEKWRITASFENFSLDIAYQAQFYAAALAAKNEAAQIEIISPYDGNTLTVAAKCVSLTTPGMLQNAPRVYGRVGAVFEEV